MSSTHTIAALLIGAFTLAPVAVFAEESVATDPTTGAPVPTLYQEQVAKPPVREGIMLRDKNATATRMMASGTRPIPKAVQTQIEARAEQMERLRSNCTLPDGTIASRTDCATFRQERREEMRERVVERRGEALRALATIMIKRLEAVITRQNKLADRIDARITKLKEQGVDVAAATAKVMLARAKVVEATAAVETAKKDIEAAVVAANATASSSVVKDAGKSVREEMQKARIALLASHQALVDAVASLKANVKTATPSAASSSAQ